MRLRYIIFVLFSFISMRVVAHPVQALLDSAVAYKSKDYNKVILFAGQAYQQAYQQHDTNSLAESSFLLGYANYLAGNHDEALRSYLEAEHYFSTLNSVKGLIKVYNELCVFYVKQKKFTQAYQVSSAAIQQAASLHDTDQLANGNNNRGLVFLDDNKEDSAIFHFRLAYHYYERVGAKLGMAYSLDYLSSIYATKQPDVALSYLKRSSELRATSGDRMGEAIAINNIGELLLQQKKTTEALKYFEDAGNKAHELHYNELESYTWRMRAEAYKQSGDYKKAYDAEQRYEELREQILNEKQLAHIDELQTKYETGKKEQRNQLLLEQNKLQSLKLNRNRMIIFALAVIVLLVVVISYLLYKRYQQKEAAKLQEALMQQQKLRAQAIVEAEENERQRLARELHDGVGQLLFATRRKMESMQVNEKVADNSYAESPIELLDASIKEIRQLSHGMMPPSLRNKTLLQAIEELVFNIRENTTLQISTSWVNMDQLELEKIPTLMLYRTVQEIMGNAIKHAKAQKIEIELVNHEDEVVLMVYDDGVGFDKNKVQEQGNGIGLKNIQSRIDYIGGKLEIDSTPGKGTTYIIELALNEIVNDRP